MIEVHFTKSRGRKTNVHVEELENPDFKPLVDTGSSILGEQMAYEHDVSYRLQLNCIS